MTNFKIFILILAFGVSAEAEVSNLRTSFPSVEETSRKHFILEAGYIGGLSTAQSELSDAQHGISGGVLFDVLGERYLNFETGIFVTQQGFTYGPKELKTGGATDLSALTDIKISGKLTYIGIPILAKFNLAGRVTNTAFLIAGVTPQYLLDNEMNISGKDTGGLTQNIKPTTGNEYEAPSFDVTGMIGLGGSFNFSNFQTLLVQLSYNRGFIPVDTIGQGVYNQSFLLTLGFGVDL